MNLADAVEIKAASSVSEGKLRKKELRKELCLLDWMPSTLRSLGLDTSQIEDLDVMITGDNLFLT